MRLKPTMEDYKEALCRSFLLSAKRWQGIEQKARQVAAERKLNEGKRRVDELLLVPPGSPKWRAAMGEIDRLWAEHDKLLDIAYPRPASEEEDEA